MASLQRGPPLGPWPDGASRRPPDENQPMDYLDVMWSLTKYKNISTTVIRLKAQNLEISFTAFWYSVYILQINIYAYTCTFYIPFEIISRAYKWAITLHLLWPQGPSPIWGLNCKTLTLTRKKIHLKQTGQLWNIGLFIFHSYVDAAIIGEGLQILTNTRHS